MNEKDMKRNAAISEKLKQYPEIITKYYGDLLESGKSLGTARTYMSSIFQFLDYCYGNNIPDDFFCDISENVITLFLDSLRAKGNQNEQASCSAKAAVWSALMSLFSFVSNKYPQIKNPVTHIPRPAQWKKSGSDVVYLTPTEVATLLQAVEKDVAYKFFYRDKCILMLGLYCGLQITEILALNVSDVDFENETIRIIDHKKGDRYVPMGKMLQFELRGCIAEREYIVDCIESEALFISQINARLSPDMVQKLLNKYSAGIGKRVTPRVLRNTFAVNLYAKTGDILLCAKYLDHASIATTQKYIEKVAVHNKGILDIDDLYF